MNMPIGITGTAVGSTCTGFLTNIGFDDSCKAFLQRLSLMALEDEGAESDGSMFTNILVLIITGIWGYVLSTIVNSEKPVKKGEKEL